MSFGQKKPFKLNPFGATDPVLVKVPEMVENYYDTDSNIGYWISGPKKGGDDTLYQGVVEIDDDVNEEYWTEIRKRPDMTGTPSYKSLGKYSKSGRRDRRPKGVLSPGIAP